jgi:hypothetical protein
MRDVIQRNTTREIGLSVCHGGGGEEEACKYAKEEAFHASTAPWFSQKQCHRHIYGCRVFEACTDILVLDLVR